jgi:signal transduction histidine kinase
MTARDQGARLSRGVNIALASFVAVVFCLGAAAWVAVGALGEQVERWAAVDAVDDARETLVDALEARHALTGERDIDNAAAAFDALARAVDDLAGADPAAAAQAPQALISQARAAFENAEGAERAAHRALESLRKLVDHVIETAGLEAAAARNAAAASARRSSALDDAQRDGADQLQALMSAVVAVERVRQRIDAFDRLGAHLATSDVSIDLAGVPPVCAPDAPKEPKAACEPSTARLRAAHAALTEDLTGEAAAEALKKVGWAAEAYLRGAERAFADLSARMDAGVDQAREERFITGALTERERSIVRLNRALTDLRAQVELLDKSGSVSLDDLALRLKGLHDQVRFRTMGIFGAMASDPSTAAVVQDDVAAIGDSWVAAVAAARAQRTSAAVMSDAIATLDRAVSGAADSARRIAEESIALFGTVTAALLLAVVAGAGAAAWAAYHRVARPLAETTGAILRLSRGGLERPVTAGSGGKAFAGVFDAIETLRLANIERLELERRNTASTLRLERQRSEAERLEQALEQERGKADFHRRVISMVNHELRTPLAVIDGQARWIGRKLGQVDEAAVRERVATIRGAVTRLTDLMETFLLNARVESGKLDYRPEPHDLRALLTEVCAMQTAATRTHLIDADLGCAPERFPGDARLLRQAFANLLSNAVKYSPHADRVAIRCWTGEGRVSISVRDWGLGVPSGEVERLGGQFFRASTHGGIMGTGIGLYLVKSIIEAHGGVLRIESEVGKGSTFTVELPLAAADVGDTERTAA